MLEGTYIGVAIYTTTLQARTGIDDGNPAEAVNSTFSALMVILLCQNVYLTSLIVWKLWHVHGMVAEYRTGSQLLAVAKAVARSGALFSAACIVNATVAYADTTVSNIMADMLAPITGISFALMIIGVGPGLLDAHASPSPSSLPRASGAGSQKEHDYPLDTIPVNIRRTVDIEHGTDTIDGGSSVDQTSIKEDRLRDGRR